MAVGTHGGKARRQQVLAVRVAIRDGSDNVVAVELEDEFVLEARGKGRLVEGGHTRLEGRAVDDGAEVHVPVEAGEEDEKVRVALVNGAGALLHLVVPGHPVVRVQEVFGVVPEAHGRAQFIVEGHGHDVGPCTFGLRKKKGGGTD